MKRTTGDESVRRWNVLLGRKAASDLPSNNVAASASSSSNHDVEEDPFDCSSVAIPSTVGLVDTTIQQFIHQWKQLDARKIIPDDDELSDGSDDRHAVDDPKQQGTSSRRKRARLRRCTIGWHAHRLLLPDNFDYASRRQEPPPDNDDQTVIGSERVISLLNPSVHLSYEQELWKLFHAVPTVEELEKDALEGHQLHHTFQLHAEMINALRDSGRLDGHALSRLRMNDRHGLPPGPSSTPHVQPSNNNSNNNTTEHNSTVSTVRLEIWRRQQQLRRGPSPDPHRMVLEFLGEQTLLDVHLAIVELSEDELWPDDDDDDTNQDQSNNNQGSEPSGVFFIEGVFYTSGTVDYAEPICKWIDDVKKNDAKRHRSKRTFLGIPAADTSSFSSSPSILSTQPMSQTKLHSLSLRLGVRYYHAHHGDVESAVFVSDLRYGAKHENVPYPILHDLWCPSTSMAECEACLHRPAVVVTAPSCSITDGGPRTICEKCYRHLTNSLVVNNSNTGNEPSQQQQQEKLDVTNISIWRDQPDLSFAASNEMFFLKTRKK